MTSKKSPTLLFLEHSSLSPSFRLFENARQPPQSSTFESMSRVCLRNCIEVLTGTSRGLGPRRQRRNAHSLKFNRFYFATCSSLPFKPKLSIATAVPVATASTWNYIPKPTIEIVEVGPRDGLQNESHPITTNQKVEFIQRLVHAGCRRLEVGSFVSPKWVPSMADSDQVVIQLAHWRQEEQQQRQQQQQQQQHALSSPSSFSSSTVSQSAKFSCLVPNQKGFQQAVSPQCASGVDEIAIFASASEAFSQKNIHCTIQESLERFQPVLEEALSRNLPVRGYVSCVVGCPYQGVVEPSAVAYVVERLLEMGCYEISLGDTIGVGTPGSTRRMLDTVQAVATSSNQLAVHYHDTYGQALANIVVALDRGITIIDSSVAGLGGCPYAKGASGNVATEDVVYMLYVYESIQRDIVFVITGIDLDKLVEVGEFICTILERPNQSKVARAMISKRRNL